MSLHKPSCTLRREQTASPLPCLRRLVYGLRRPALSGQCSHLLTRGVALRLRVRQLPGHARNVAGLGFQTGAVLLGLRRQRGPLRLELRHLCADARPSLAGAVIRIFDVNALCCSLQQALDLPPPDDQQGERF